MTINKQREVLAEYAHDAWSGWMSYLFSLCISNDDGSVTIPDSLVRRWSRQATTKYCGLPESEKDSDRAEADKMFALLDGKMKEATQNLCNQIEAEGGHGYRVHELAREAQEVQNE